MKAGWTAGLVGVAGAALLLAGCEPSFDGDPTGEQVGKRKVAIDFTLCEASESGVCASEGQDAVVSILIGFRVPRGTRVPDSFESISGTPVELTRNDEYKYHLNQLAPRNRKRFKWFGYRSDVFAADDPGIERATFTVRMTVPEDFRAKRLKVRPVVSEMNAEERVDCGESAYEQGANPRATTVCITNPGPEQLEENLEIRVKRPERF